MRVPLDIPPGINSDDTGFSAGNRWADGDNVRFWNGRPQVIGGWIDALSGSTLTGVCRNLHTWSNSNGAVAIAFGTHSALQVYYNGGLYTITPSGLATGSIDSAGGSPGWGSGTWGSGTWGSPATVYYARTWSLSNYGSYLIANPRGGTIYEWTGNTASLATAVTNAPAVVTFALATPQRQLLAFGCNEELSGNFNPLCIRGSDIEDITDWTTTATNNAFEEVLSNGGGRIVAARNIGAYLAVWTDEALFMGTFIGQPEQTYRFDRVGDNCGLIGPNAAEIVDQTALWMAPDRRMRMWTVGDRVKQIPTTIGQDFIDNLETGQEDKIAASALSAFNEVWWHYPDSRDGTENSRYIALGLEEGSGWFRGTLARTATFNSGVVRSPIKVTYGGVVYYHENGTTAAGSALSWSLTSADMFLDEGQQAVMVRGITPDFYEQAGDISATFYAKQYPQSTASTYGPYTLTTATTKKDLRFNGRLLSVKFSGGDSSGTFARFGRTSLDIVQTGRR